MQSWSFSRLPQSMTLLPSCLTALDVLPSYCAGGLASSLMPHQLMLFVHSLCAFRTASTTTSRSMPVAVAPIHQCLGSRQWAGPIDACEELSHFTLAPISSGGTA